MEFRERLLQRAAELQWHPPYMQARVENWINGLNGDWCVSRQRFFGVPFPVWYKVRDDGTIDHSARLLPAEEQLPIDPSTDVPDGYSPAQRDQPGGFTGDPDIMDTWATSSLTPQIVGRWEEDRGPVRARVPDGRPAAGARHHPHVALLDDAPLRARTRHAALVARGDLRMGARSGSQEDVEVQGQRRHADGAARGARVRRRALLGGERQAGHRHGVRHGTDEGRPAAGDQAAQRLEVRPRAGRNRQAPSRIRSIAGCSPACASSSKTRRGRSRRTTTHARCRSARRSSGRSATTTSRW